MTTDYWSMAFVFVLATFIGLGVIRRVSVRRASSLATPIFLRRSFQRPIIDPSILPAAAGAQRGAVADRVHRLAYFPQQIVCPLGETVGVTGDPRRGQPRGQLVHRGGVKLQVVTHVIHRSRASS